MKPANEYPVTLNYGATSAPYSPSKPHKGRDRGCPAGSPLVIGGQIIGLTGATGYVFGAHLHCQEWKGGYATTREPQNEFKVGIVVNVDLNGTQGDGTFGKFITIQTDDGWNDTYCHLSQINVKVGDKVGQGDDEVFKNDEEVNDAYLAILHRRANTVADKRNWVGKKPQDLNVAFIKSPEWNQQNDILLRAYPELLKKVQELQAQVDRGEVNDKTNQVLDDLKNIVNKYQG